ncbi:hypothetical protein Tco_0117921 [Tanacetum coccineum]
MDWTYFMKNWKDDDLEESFCVDGKRLVGFDKKKLEWLPLHTTMVTSLRDCYRKGDSLMERKRADSFLQHQEAGKKTKNQMGLLKMDDGGGKDYTPKPQEEIDESLYVYGKKGPQEPEPSVSDDRSSEYSTCQSNDSAESIGTSTEHSFDPESEISRVPKEVYMSKPLTTNAQDCDYYEKKMAREAEVKKQRVFNTGNRMAKPVWINDDRINHANHFVPRSSTELLLDHPLKNMVDSSINSGS